MLDEFGYVFGTNERFRLTEFTVSAPSWVGKKRQPLTDQEKKEILQLRLQHVPYKEIERMYGVTATAIHQIQVDAGYCQYLGNMIG